MEFKLLYNNKFYIYTTFIVKNVCYHCSAYFWVSTFDNVLVYNFVMKVHNCSLSEFLIKNYKTKF